MWATATEHCGSSALLARARLAGGAWPCYKSGRTAPCVSHMSLGYMAERENCQTQMGMAQGILKMIITRHGFGKLELNLN